MKKSILLGLISLTVCLFTACSSDSDDNNNGNQNTKEEKLVGCIEQVLGNDYSSSTYKDFKYDTQDRLISVTKENTDRGSSSTSVMTYSYSPNTISMQTTDEKVTYSLANGRITKSVSTNRDGEEICEFTYDNAGQLTKVTRSTDRDVINISWENGNIIYADGTTFTYTDYPSKKFVSTDNLEHCIPRLDGVDPFLFQQGYYGKYPHNLVKAANNGNGTISCTYTFDNKGNVLTATEGKVKGTFTWQ